MLEIILYGSYLVFPFLGVLFWFWRRKMIAKWLVITFAILSVIFIYARFIERYIVLTHEHGDGEVRVALIGDMHIGVYKSPKFLARLVEKINEANPDVVLIAGDFVYGMDPEDLKDSFAPLENLHAPVFGVLGNHDILPSGEFTKKEMYEALSPYIYMIDNSYVKVKVGGKDVTIAGVGEIWANDANFESLNNVRDEENLIVLVHQPDSVYSFPEDFHPDLTLAAHTHGGQVRLPFIYKYMIPTIHPFDQGWYEINGDKVFVTNGVGEDMLPLRFLIPPTIDIMKF